MKRRNTRPGRRLDARPGGGGGSLPLPAYPGEGRPRLQEMEDGLHAPSYHSQGGGPVLFGRDASEEWCARRFRPGRPDSRRPLGSTHATIQSMSAYEAFGMRLMVN